MDIENKRVIIIGTGTSGASAAKLANQKKAKVAIYDQKPWIKFDNKEQECLNSLNELGVELLLGVELEKYIKNYELIIMSPGVPMDLPFIVCAKDCGIPIIGELEFAWNYCNSNVIAITGTNGKTTTTTLVGEIIKEYIARTFVVGNIGRAFSQDALSINKEDAVVAEVSSFQLESISKFHPKIGAILNITPDHLNRHGTMENYIKAKKRIFENQNKKDFLILNYDDLECRRMVDESDSKVIWFSRKQKPIPGVYIDNGYIVENIFNTPNTICSISDLKILGDHNIENALASVAITTTFGIPTRIISNKLISFQGVAHRIEYIGTKKNIDFYNDSKATNTDAAIKGLLAMQKKVRLIIGGLDKEADFMDWISLFHNRVERAYVIGETKEQLVKSMELQGFYNYMTFKTLEDAIYAAYNDAKDGECVLLSPGCASWDMFKSYEQRGDLFKEIFQNLRE